MAAHMQRLQPGQQKDGDKDKENRANPGQQRGLVTQTVNPMRNGAFEDHHAESDEKRGHQEEER